MDKLNVNTIEPEGATTTLNVGISGKSVIITDNLKANTLKDAGGNTIFTSDGSGNLSSVNSGFGSAQVLLSTQTASGDASISFTSGIDSTYKEYVFEFININPATNQQDFKFQVNASGQSGYDETMTTTAWRAYHQESGGAAALAYQASEDQAQGTSFQTLMHYVGNGADEASSGEMHLFNPSSTTYVKNFWSKASVYDGSPDPTLNNYFAAGYINVTAAITEIQFKMTSGNLDGTIKMYGIK